MVAIFTRLTSVAHTRNGRLVQRPCRSIPIRIDQQAVEDRGDGQRMLPLAASPARLSPSVRLLPPAAWSALRRGRPQRSRGLADVRVRVDLDVVALGGAQKLLAGALLRSLALELSLVEACDANVRGVVDWKVLAALRDAGPTLRGSRSCRPTMWLRRPPCPMSSLRPSLTMIRRGPSAHQPLISRSYP